MMQLIKQFNKAYLQLCDEFAKRWMGEDFKDGEDIRDYYRLVGESGWGLPGPMDIGDYMFSLDNIWEIINYNIPIDIVSKWYSDYIEGNHKMNLYHYRRLEGK